MAAPYTKREKSEADSNRIRFIHGLAVFDVMSLTSILEYLLDGNHKRKMYFISRIREVISFIDFDELVQIESEVLRYVLITAICYILDIYENDEVLPKSDPIIDSEIIDRLPKKGAYRAEYVTVVAPIISRRGMMDKENLITDNQLAKQLSRVLAKLKAHKMYFYLLEQGSKIATSSFVKLPEVIDDFIAGTRKYADTLENYRSSKGTTTFFRNDNKYHEMMEQAYTDAKKKDAVLRTGIQALNYMISPRGGFTEGLYMFYARVNSFKSALLMYLAKSIAKYNNDSVAPIIESGLLPTVVFISLENTISEDLSRQYTMDTGRQLYTASSAQDAVASVHSGEIDIYNVYSDKNQIDIDEIRRIHRKLIETEGRQPIVYCIDYMRKLRPDNQVMSSAESKEYRLTLGSLSDSLNRLATKELGVPIITAHHLNREADNAIADAKRRGVNNLVNYLHTGYLSESKDIENYVIWSAFIEVEENEETGQKFLGIKREKVRSERTTIKHLVQEIVNGIQLKEDIFLRESLSQMSVEPGERLFLSSVYPNTFLINNNMLKKIEEEEEQHEEIETIESDDIIISEEGMVFHNMYKPTIISEGTFKLDDMTFMQTYKGEDSDQ